MFLTLYLDIELHSIFWRYIASTAFYRYEGIKKKTFLLGSPIFRLKKPSKLRANLRKTNLFLCKKAMDLSLWTIPISFDNSDEKKRFLRGPNKCGCRCSGLTVFILVLELSFLQVLSTCNKLTSNEFFWKN